MASPSEAEGDAIDEPSRSAVEKDIRKELWRRLKCNPSEIKRLALDAILSGKDAAWSEDVDQLELAMMDRAHKNLTASMDGDWHILHGTTKALDAYRKFSRSPVSEGGGRFRERVELCRGQEDERITIHFTIEAEWYACGSVNLGDVCIEDLRCTHLPERPLDRGDHRSIMSLLQEWVSQEVDLDDFHREGWFSDVSQLLCYRMDEQEFELMEEEEWASRKKLYLVDADVDSDGGQGQPAR